MNCTNLAKTIAEQAGNLAYFADTADAAMSESLANLTKKLLESEFRRIERGINKKYSGLDDDVSISAIAMLLGTMSENSFLNDLGAEGAKSHNKREKRVQKTKKDLYTALNKIDSFSLDDLAVTIEQLQQFGLDHALRYVLNGTKTVDTLDLSKL